MDIKEHLYNRINDLKEQIRFNTSIVPIDAFDGGNISGETSQCEDEIDFITRLLDTMEKQNA